MGIIVDLILVLVLLIFTFWGYKKGLTGSLLKLLSFVIAIVIAIALYKPVASYVNKNTQIDDKIKSSIVDIFDKQEERPQTEEENEDNKEGIKGIIFKEISEDIKNTASEAKTEIVNKSAEKITETVINIGAGIVIYLAARLILVVISFFIKGITELPVIKQVDKTGGIIYGFAQGMLIIYVVLGIISLIALAAPGSSIVTAITKSAIGGMLYNNNLILNILM